ncbi:hypothetical protein HanRHA438_Chr16g0755871 [Helianthus annuus]|uniref:Uncharacterized protein n=2 Tax=Helianthus annuus TaxID=4232 RepID=A0A9K3DS35_HELAN|nr:hypothetical protein HanXRQr2_Chr16g0743981 [Helianthus annuus]KAJ0437831.1 hypothetical protein HanHA300_Chr16g0606731 [Helianthus annuus]KAJ0442392.1 hypothetical protein HanIR_Chr16g0808701 [Helianthus annuus]KAJ0460155.1 hypothetical protein HanHA89_Chr16g0657321 [Helianthus annuus]KAJ0640596.1 hypothetical protein HanLR1_Chr16g0617331 [Helianthus annuus]
MSGFLKKKRSRKITPKVQAKEGSSSQPKKKRQKKVVETLLVDEPEDDEPEADVEKDQNPVSPTMEQILKDIDYGSEAEKAAGENEGDNEEKSSSSSSESEIDETERLKRIKADIEKEKQLKRKRRKEKDDDLYIPSPEHVQEVQTPPSEGRKKSNARKRVVSPKVRKLTIKLNPKHASKPKQPTPPEHQPSPPYQSPPHESPPKQTSPPHHQQQLSPPHSLSQIHISTPTHEQPVITSQHIIQTPPTIQSQVQTTPSSSGFKNFPRVPENIGLEDIGDFSFVNDELVKKL